MVIMNNAIAYLLRNEENRTSEFYHVLKENPVSKDVIDYIYNVILPLKVKIRDNDKMPARCLYNQGKFLGWCWETTQTIAPLIENAYIARGYLYFKRRNFDEPSLIEYDSYEHAWLYFIYNGCQYVFDPCLKIICTRSLFDDLFEVILTKEFDTYDVKQEFIDTLKYCGTCLDREKAIYKANIRGTESKWSNIYMGNIDYIATLGDNRILSLEAYYIGHH